MGILLKNKRSTFRLPHGSLLAYTYSVVKVRKPRDLTFPAAHVGAHHACLSLHFGEVLPTIRDRRGARSAVAGWFGCLGSAGALASDSPKVRGRRFACQQSGPLALLIVWHGAHAAHPVMEPRTPAHAQIPQARPLCQAILKSCNVPH
jgi:hypothetical protein